MIAGIRGLSLETKDAFLADPRNVAAAESYLRRALEALLDLGRHLLAKGFGRPATEHKAVASELAEVGVLDQADADLLRRLAGYRNRMVHFYDEVSDHELYEICATQLADPERILAALLKWIRDNPEKIDHAI